METSNERLLRLNNELILATQNGNLDQMKKFIAEGASKNACDLLGNNLLILATQIGDFGILEYLLDLGLDPNATNLLNLSAHNIAEKNYRLDIMNFFTSHNKRNLLFSYNNPIGIEAMSKSYEDSPDDLQSYVKDKKNKSKILGCFG